MMIRVALACVMSSILLKSASGLAALKKHFIWKMVHRDSYVKCLIEG